MLDQYGCLRQDPIEVYFVYADREVADETAATLNKAASALSTYFRIDEPLPILRAILAPDRETFDVLVADLLGVKIERPSDPRRIAQPQRTDMVFLSPSAYEAQSAYEYVPEDFQRMVHHELVHVIQEHLSPGIEESPFWFDEGLAVYFSRQWMHNSQFGFREPVLDSLRDGKLPSLSDISTTPSLGYEFGWTLVRFIEQQHGKDEIIRIITQMKDGDIFSLLGEERDSFEEGWRSWLQAGKGLMP